MPRRSASKPEDADRDVLRVLAMDADAWFTTEEVEKYADRDHGTCHRALSRLLQIKVIRRGKLFIEGVGRPRSLYQLAPSIPKGSARYATSSMTPIDILTEAWARWLDLVRKKKRGEYVRDRTLIDAREAVEDAVERVIEERHRGR